MPYISNTDEQRKEMLGAIGVAKLEELLDSIPEKLRLNRPLDIPPLSEFELLNELKGMARKNHSADVCFAGGGVYDHFIPAAVGAIISRPEFMTAYTPYQAEVAQGTLQVIYEFQTHICRLTGMDVANASMYDGSSAAAEAVLLCCSSTKRDRVVVSEAVNPLWRAVMISYMEPRGIELINLPMTGGQTDLNRLQDVVDEKTACVVISQPNFFGSIEDADTVAETVHKVGGMLIMGVDPIAQTILKTPADSGADVVVGEGQPLGVPLSYGGPLLGFFAVKRDLIRSLPGRLAARTKDVDGKTGFVLTLQTREQHIRRQKATSNICTNQALCATAATVYMSLLGKSGLKKVALLSAQRAQEAASAIASIEGFELYFDAPFVREFAVRTPRPAGEIVLGAMEGGILPGIDAGRWYPDYNDCLIVAATEKRTAEEIARLVDGLKELTTSAVLPRLQD